MIQIKLKLNNTKQEQIEKITEEFKEVKDAFNDTMVKNFQYTHLNHELVGECFDLIQATNQLIRMLVDEKGYLDLYKMHLKKLQERINDGEIKVDEYLEV